MLDSASPEVGGFETSEDTNADPFTLGVRSGAGDRLAPAMQMGASARVNYSPDSIRDAVMEATDGLGVDLVYEMSVARSSARACSRPEPVAALSAAGAHAADLVDLDVIELFRSERAIIGSMACTIDEVEHIVGLASDEHLDPVIDGEPPLSMAAEAPPAIARETFVRLVLVPDVPGSSPMSAT